MKKKSRLKGGIKMAEAFLAGAVVAGTAGMYYLYGPNGKKNRKKVEVWTIKAKADVLDKLEKSKQVTEDKYHQVVDTVVAKYSKMKDIGAKKAEDLGKELKRHWKEVKKEVERKS